MKLNIDERIRCLRKEALSRGIPVAEDETLNYLLLMISAVRPKHILEIGTAVGLSSAAMLLQCPTAQVVTIEVEEERYLEAKKILRLWDFPSAPPVISATQGKSFP